MRRSGEFNIELEQGVVMKNIFLDVNKHSNLNVIYINNNLNDIYLSNFSFPYLRICNHGIGTLLLSKIDNLSEQPLVMFPNELKYLCYFKNGRDKPIEVDTLLFSTNTKYIDLDSLCEGFKFKTLMISRDTKLVGGIVKFKFEIVYID